MSSYVCPALPMGWNSWNTFQTSIDEQQISDRADAMFITGMRDARYVRSNLNDESSTREHGADGNLIPDPRLSSNGMKGLGDYLHERGFRELVGQMALDWSELTFLKGQTLHVRKHWAAKNVMISPRYIFEN